MTSRITLLCVPATAALRAGRFPADDALEADAIARLAAGRVDLGQPDHVLRSPMACARDTAHALGLVAAVDDALREIDYGRWRGLSLKEIGASEPDALAAWLSEPDMDAHGGESLAATIARAGRWLSGRSGSEGGMGVGSEGGSECAHTLAITHASLIRAAVVHALHAPAQACLRLDVAPLSLTTLSGRPGQWRVSSVGVPFI